MSLVKSLVGRVLRVMAPETMRTLEHAAGLRRSGGHGVDIVQRVDDLQVRLERVERQVAELDGMPTVVDELRRDSLRIAELTDLVVSTLGARSVSSPSSDSRV